MTALNFHGMTVEDLKAKAQECRTRAAKSRDDSDTDGFLSQAASDCMAQVYILQAEIVANGGLAEFPALFDLEGNQVPAVRVDGQYGMSWKLLDPKPGQNRWFNESKATRKGVARSTDAKNGFYVGYAMAPAVADTAGNACSFWAVIRPVNRWEYIPAVEITDNGIGETNLHKHYDIWEN